MIRRFALTAVILVPLTAGGYPLDGFEESGIRRLEGYRLAQDNTSGARLAPGQLWPGEAITLALADYAGPDFDALPEDPELAAAISGMLRGRDPSYSLVLVDVGDPADIRWAGLRPDLRQNPGSVGKVMCMAALFHTLAEAFPATDDRRRILRETEVAAGSWVTNEVHVVPKWSDAENRNRFSVIVPSDSFRLSEWIDHAISASANGAGTVIWREAMLLRAFGSRYPVSEAERERFFAETPKRELGELALAVISEPLAAAGIDTGNLQQGSMFTGAGKNKVPGTQSFATPRELARLMFRIEQGRLVDAWSSLEMKKYMYLTKRRYRYAYAPELAEAAVFFKSGSLYSCQPEEGFRCGKYLGNVRNMMNSVAIVEQPDEDLHYIAALMSNVLRFNSAWDHSRIAAAVHETLRTNERQALQETASEKEIADSGRSE